MSRYYRTLLNPPPPLLLDTYPATAAYSLRYLSNDFKGSDVVTVRSSSDDSEQGFTPTEITDGTLESFCGAGDGFVKTWYDQEGGLDITQVSNSNQLKIVSSGSLITENGKPALQASGAQWMDGNLPSSLSFPFSYLFVGKRGGGGSREDFLGFTVSAASSTCGLTYTPNSTSTNIFNGSVQAGGGSSASQSIIFSAFTNSANDTLYRNGAQEISGVNAGSRVPGGKIAITREPTGAGFYLNGTFQELIIWDSNQVSNISEILSNRNNYYGAY